MVTYYSRLQQLECLFRRVLLDISDEYIENSEDSDLHVIILLLLSINQEELVHSLQIQKLIDVSNYQGFVDI